MTSQAPGTRFRVFSQAPWLLAGLEPDTVEISTPPCEMQAGPADARAYVIDPVDKPQRYNDFYGPPFIGPVYYPALPDAEGHFDHIPINCREFRAAHMFASIRFTLDVWERYFGRRINWHFSPLRERLELVTFVPWDNAHSGFGFIEAGYGMTGAGEAKLYSLNFDVMAHEVGHSIIFAEVGVPPPGAPWSDEYRSFHESASDLIALVSALHLDSVRERLLASTHGNLYGYNELGRIGELSNTEQIRLACNDIRLSTLDGLGDHGRSLLLTGALFDFLVEIFQRTLVEQGILGEDIAFLSYGMPGHPAAQRAIQEAFERAYSDDPATMHHALIHARDYLGVFLANTWQQLPASRIDYTFLASVMIDTEAASGGRYLDILSDCLRWREIQLPLSTPCLHQAHA